MSDDFIRCISLWNPWANWVSLGWKRIETRLHRRFACLNGQRIGIHAAMKWDKDAIKLAQLYLSAAQLLQSQEFLRVGGHIICTAFVADFRELTDNDSDAALIDCGSVRRYGLELTDIQMVPVTDASCVKGAQGIFKVPTCALAASEGASK